MELTQKEIEAVKEILIKADGEDVGQIIEDLGFEDWLLRALVMRASKEYIQYLIEEKLELEQI